MNRIDSNGRLWEDFFGGIWNWLVDTYERSLELQRQQQILDDHIRQEQIDILKKGVQAIGDAYMRGYEMQQEAQLQNSMAVIEGIRILLNDPETTIDLIIAMESIRGAACTIAIACVTGTTSITVGTIGTIVVGIWGVYRAFKGFMGNQAKEG